MRILILALFGGVTLFSTPLQGQEDSSYVAEILQYRQEYAQHLIEGERHPLEAPDTVFLDFFPPDPAYKLVADLVLTPEAEPFEMPTSSGRTKTFVQYGWVVFSFGSDTLQLAVYRNLMLNLDMYKNHLFMPFKDGSCGETTYGGGRYLDLSIEDIQEGKIELDFNLVYNPWCAFSDGFNCPIPPDVNKLEVVIEAGEKEFTKPY